MEGCILLKDKHAKKAPASALKGELLTVIPGDTLVPSSDRKRHHNYQEGNEEKVQKERNGEKHSGVHVLLVICII